jgi:hypothetical protein
MTHQHPLRSVEISVYQRIEGNGPAFKASYGDPKRFPIFFRGDTADEARDSAQQFAAEAVAKNEAAFIARAIANDKARAAREAKGAAQ